MRRAAIGIALLLLALAVALALSACGGGDGVDSGAESPAERASPSAPRPSDPPGEAPAPRTATAPAQATVAREVTVRLGEWFFEADQRKVKAGNVVVRARNVGTVEHDLIAVKTGLPAHRMPMTPQGAPDVDRAGRVVMGGHHSAASGAPDDIHVMPGETQQVRLALEPGRYVLVCSFPGHYQAGQYASLMVVP